MIKLNQKQQIIVSSYFEGKSKKAIARDTGLNIKTVRKYISNYENERQKLMSSKGG